MSQITVTEKNYWKDSIGRRIDKKIEAVYAEDPGLRDRIWTDARAKALKSLALDKLQRALDEIREQKALLDKKEKATQRSMLAKVRGVAPDTLPDHVWYGWEQEITSAIGKRQSVHEEELLRHQPTGKLILKLQREKDRLLDTIWLATSPRQMTDLWKKVGELLGESPSELEHEAIGLSSKQ